MPENELFIVATATGSVSSNKVSVQFPGDSTAMKSYQVIYPTGIANGVRVLCARVSGTWVVIGALLA